MGCEVCITDCDMIGDPPGIGSAQPTSIGCVRCARVCCVCGVYVWYGSPEMVRVPMWYAYRYGTAYYNTGTFFTSVVPLKVIFSTV